jgi:hypothetical protein
MLGQNLLYLMKFQRVFNLNPKISKLAVYLPEVSKSGKVNPSINFSVKLDGKL